ncbi:uncharacterized protein LOC142329669 [Lycorma delicatula]|uniref:uncharacterized protein LOC142329669 n=1 Tax=Lycorma delicatula TaxID=130591 RepID=UPI003F50FC87
MSMVEGIGDEVIQFFAVIIIIFLALIAWWSTNISDGPLIRTVLILERRTRGRASNDSNPQPSVTLSTDENSIDTGQGDPAAIQELVETETTDRLNGGNGDDKEENESSSSLLLPNSQEPAATVQVNNSSASDNQNPEVTENQESHQQPQEIEITTVKNDSDSSILRKRRLAFFQSRGPTLLESSSSSDCEYETTTAVSDAVAEEEISSSTNPDHIRIRLKYLNDDQIVVEGRLQEQLGDFKRRHFSIELAAEKMVRLIFNGQVLQSDSQTLQGYGLFDNCVVHCLVHNQRNNTPRTAQTQTSGASNQAPPPDWNLGTLLYTCLSVILCFAWYCRYQYSHLFTVTTTAALFGLTGMFVITLLSIYLPDHDVIQ